MENNKPNFLIVKIFFILIGVVICYFSIKGLISYYDFHSRAISTIGHVVSYSENDHTINLTFGNNYIATFDYWAHCKDGAGYGPKVGDAINMIYDSQNPKSIRISGTNDWYCFDTREAAPNMMIFLAGGIALILAILILPYLKLNQKNV